MNCPDLKKLLAANGRKLSKDYQGAFEKSKARKGTVVAAALIPGLSDDASDDGEWSETDLAFALTPNTLDLCCGPCSPCTHPNVFAALGSDDGEEDEEERIFQACAQLTEHVTVGMKVPQSDRREPKPLGPSKIAQIVAQVKSGEIHLDELDKTVAEDRDLVAVWALTDSGSGVHIANHDVNFPGSKLEKNKFQETKYMAANKSEIVNEGEMAIRARTAEGHSVRIPFQSAKVGMPILSVAQLAKKYDSVFRQDDGDLVHRNTGKKVGFVKKAGVYFIQLMVPRPVASQKLSERCPFGGQANESVGHVRRL